jgi:hypothetical protein
MSVARPVAARLLLVFAALCLAGGACVHTLSYPKVAGVAEHSSLPTLFTAAFKALWLIDSVGSMVLALAFALVAAFPGTASRSVVVLLALAPLAYAIALFSTMGNFFPGYLMLVAGAAALIGGVLHHRAPAA